MSKLNEPLNANSSLQERAMKRDVSFAKKGIFLVLFAAVLYACSAIFMGYGQGRSPFDATGYSILLLPLIACALEEFSGSIVTFVRNVKNGKVKEYGRTLRTTPGKFICIGGVCGGCLGTMCMMGAIKFCGPAYTNAILALYPLFGFIGNVIFMKEKTNKRFWIGAVLCILGAIAVAYAPAEGVDRGTFYIGILMAFIAAILIGSESVFANFGMDTCDSDIAAGLRVMSATITAVIFILIFGGLDGFGVMVSCFTIFPLTFVFLFFAGLFNSLSLTSWYTAFGMTGASRASALNTTYAIWTIVFSMILSAMGLMEFSLTIYLAIGALLMVVGVTIVIANPKEMLQLRNNN